jgi:hypothetical protein
MKNLKGAAIVIAAFVILYLLWPRMCSSFTDANVSKARELLGKGMKDIDVTVELVKTGVNPDIAVKAVSEAKGSPAIIK